jgi:hypothetical protein
MSEFNNPRKKQSTQKITNYIICGFMVIFVTLSLLVLLGVFGFQTGQEKLAGSLLVFWLGLLLSYYTWAIHFYNINLGKTDNEWEVIWVRVNRATKRKDRGLDYDKDDLVGPKENPYKGETFGLPAGTVRGTIALTLLMGGMAMFFMSIGDPQFNFFENFDFFIQAFLMMVAFYFGSKALSYMQQGEKKKKDKPDSSPPTKDVTMPIPMLQKVVEQAVQKAKKEEVGIVQEFPQVAEQEQNKKLNNDEIKLAAKSLKIEPAALKAVTVVESSGKGFLKNGQPKILFEGHIFWKELKKQNINPTQYAAAHKDILYEKWTRQFYKGGVAEYDRLERAKLINNEAALKSASWGLFQIMGFNHKHAGFETVEEYVEAQHENEGEHLKAFCQFIKSQKMVPFLKEKNWAGFAKRYNGPSYAQNRYDVKMADAYERFKEIFKEEDLA